MKVATISSNTMPTPPLNTGMPRGWSTSIHEVISNISEGLVEKGHNVTLYASGDSTTSAKLESIWDQCSMKYELLPNQFDYKAYDEILTSFCFERNKTEKYEIIFSFHTFDSGFFANLIDTPIVSAYHGAGAWKFERIWPQKIIKPNHYVAISQSQEKNCDFIRFDQVIYNGINPSAFPFQEKNKYPNMVFVGRVNSEKGTDTAAIVSRKLNMKLDIFGTTNEQPLLNFILDQGDTICLHGHVPQKTIARAVADSKLFIFPCRWNEPFGLVLAESLACGTPIIGYAIGSLPEIIDDGVTGFLVNPEDGNIEGNWIIKKKGIEGLEEAVQRINAMPEKDYLKMRLACRQRFERNFTKEIMIEKYERLFKEIIKKNENLNHHDDIQLQRLY